MEEYLIYHDGVPCGTVRLEKQGLYTAFSAVCGARPGRLYSLFLEGEGGSVLLGVPEWRDGCFVLRRTLANRAWESVVTLRCARLQPRAEEEGERAAGSAEAGWMRLAHPEYFFHRLTPELSGGACYWKPLGEGRCLAVPIDDGKPFLLARYFCFAKVVRLWGKPYAVFWFDENDCPRVL